MYSYYRHGDFYFCKINDSGLSDLGRPPDFYNSDDRLVSNIGQITRKR